MQHKCSQVKIELRCIHLIGFNNKGKSKYTYEARRTGTFLDVEEAKFHRTHSNLINKTIDGDEKRKNYSLKKRRDVEN